MDLLKLVCFIVAAPLTTAVVCKLLEAFSKPSPAEIARAQEAAQSAKQDAMTAAVSREAMRQDERNELAT